MTLYTNNEHVDRGQTNKERRNCQCRYTDSKKERKKERRSDENSAAESGLDVRTAVNISIRCEVH